MRPAPIPRPSAPSAPPATVDPVLALMRSMQTAAEDMSRVMTEAKTHAGADIAARVAAELPGAIDRMVIGRQRRLVLTIAFAIVVACAACGAAGWWLRGAPPAVTCGEQSSGVVCWYWLQPPKR